MFIIYIFYNPIKNNREMGVLINKEKEPNLYKQVIKEVESIKQDSIPDKTIIRTQEKILTPQNPINGF
jgi:hypothetical protein